ncbi:hypothetical protein TNCV_1443321 [Trichonephila clavipes]|nr:hypothetical protein TNCV_1443321 [Trichonephila clavipes]
MESGQTQGASSVIERLWNRFQETGHVLCRPGQSRPFANDDQYSLLTVRRDGAANEIQIQRHYLWQQDEGFQTKKSKTGFFRVVCMQSMGATAHSPDLNPIERVWDSLGRCVDSVTSRADFIKSGIVLLITSLHPYKTGV